MPWLYLETTSMPVEVTCACTCVRAHKQSICLFSCFACHFFSVSNVLLLAIQFNISSY
jgi:hypothetical protein